MERFKPGDGPVAKFGGISLIIPKILRGKLPAPPCVG
jgi:hypothetical protein